MCLNILTCVQVGLFHNKLEQLISQEELQESSSAAAFRGPGVAVKGTLYGCQSPSCQPESATGVSLPPLCP